MSRCKVKLSKIIIAALVILLCLVFIVGATLALFTDNDGKIGINATSGDLEVDIIDDSVDNPSSLVGKTLDLVPKTPQEEILFEPGAMYHTQGFRVKNNGNIPINFIIYISEDDEVSKDFFDAFEVWITSDVSDRASGKPPQDFEGRLEVGKTSDIYYLVIKMKESAGNEYKNKTFTGVGITVCAVQGNVNIG